MPIELKMPALSPTMEEGRLAKWLVKEGDAVKSGDILAEIETDKATMEYEAVDEGTIQRIAVAEGTDGVKVGAVIATLLEEGEDASAASADVAQPAPATDAPAAPAPAASDVQARADAAPATAALPPVEEKGYGADPAEAAAAATSPAKAAPAASAPRDAAPAGGRVIASPLARRLAEQQGLDLAGVTGSGPHGRIVKADLASAPAAAPAKAEAAAPAAKAAPSTPAAPATPAKPAPVKAASPAAGPSARIPHEAVKLSGMRKTIARRLTESKQQVPHIYLTVDVRLDALLALRGQVNEALAARGIKVSVNDMLVKALGMALIEVPACNVSYAGDTLLQFSRADVSVAVSIPGGLITPIVAGAEAKSFSQIATEMKDLAGRAKANKLQPDEYQGGTASLSNMGMLGISQFAAVINPPQGMILAVGAGEQRPYVIDGKLDVATVMTVTGSFDHRAIDGADGAQLMAAFKRLVEKPLGMIA